LTHGILLLPPLIWATMFVVGQSVLGEIGPATLTFWTWLVATISLVPFVLRHVPRTVAVVRKEFIALFFFALLGVSGFQYLLFSGLLRTSVVSASVLSPTIPIMVACLGWPLLREKLSPLQVLGIVASFLGACWIATSGNLQQLVTLQLGAGESLILLANLSMAGYTILLRLYPSQLTPTAFMAVIALIGTVQVLPLSLMEVGFSAGYEQVSDYPFAIFYIGVVNYSLAYVFWNLAVKWHGATVPAIFLYLIPLLGSILSFVFLKEPVLLHHITGISVICIGLYLALHTTRPS